jgi:putative transposase
VSPPISRARTRNWYKVAPILERFGDFATLLGTPEDETASKSLRQSETTGRPLGSEHWIEQLEKLTGKALKPQKRGPETSERDDN